MTEETKKLLSRPVSWTVFTWTIAIILFLFGMINGNISDTDAKVESVDNGLHEIREQILIDLGEIKKDIAVIKTKLED